MASCTGNSATISPVKDEDGVITNFLAVKEDITERRRAEEALRENSARFHSLFDDFADLPLGRRFFGGQTAHG